MGLNCKWMQTDSPVVPIIVYPYFVYCNVGLEAKIKENIWVM